MIVRRIMITTSTYGMRLKCPGKSVNHIESSDVAAKGDRNNKKYVSFLEEARGHTLTEVKRTQPQRF